MHKRKSTGARLPTWLIGVSPLPGPPVAAYGSIIIPKAFHRRILSMWIFRNGLRFAHLLVIFYDPIGQEGPCVPFSGWASPRSGMYLLSVYSVFKVLWKRCPLPPPIADFFTHLSKKTFKNFKKIWFILFSTRKTKKHPCFPCGNNMRA